MDLGNGGSRDSGRSCIQRLRRFVRLTMAILVLTAAAACSRRHGGTLQPAVPDSTAIRTTQSGAVSGVEGRYGGQAWFGIPYAKPPVGALR